MHQLIGARSPVAAALKIAQKNSSCLQDIANIPHTPALSCLIRLEDAEDIPPGNVWPQLVQEKKLCVGHLKKKEVAHLMEGERKQEWQSLRRVRTT